MKKGYRGFIVYAVLVLAVVGIWYYLSEAALTADTYTYHQYQNDMAEGNVTQIIIEQNAETPTGTMVVSLRNGNRHEINVSDVKQEQEYLQQNGFYNYLVKNIPRASWLSTWLPYLIISLVTPLSLTSLSHASEAMVLLAVLSMSMSPKS